MRYAIVLGFLLAAGAASAQTIPPPVGGIVPGTVPSSIPEMNQQIRLATQTSSDSVRFTIGPVVANPLFQSPTGGAVQTGQGALDLLRKVTPPN